MKQQNADNLKHSNVKVSAEITKKYGDKIIFKEKFDRVRTYFKDRDLEREIEMALNNENTKL
ncbi:MAG: hypothetical protein IPL23_20040 [Saprospiraceae bacterium]|nr:hypothetical protein [Saprospiraceae bacterium]MBK8634060.1 hypothetical protein [Saprospiraceae bacterium]MBP7644871.1 hypothetical protein [Saprospiraceae bacterium]HOY14775.1 hypothetical protein [Saprospiraceae bacterium]